MHQESVKVLLPLLASALFAHAGQAADSDPGTLLDAELGYRAGRALAPGRTPAYLMPTQHYYGRGYVIAYGYAVAYGNPVNQRSANLRMPDRFTLPVNHVSEGNVDSTRVTYRSAKRPNSLVPPAIAAPPVVR